MSTRPLREKGPLPHGHHTAHSTAEPLGEDAQSERSLLPSPGRGSVWGAEGSCEGGKEGPNLSSLVRSTIAGPLPPAASTPRLFLSTSQYT